jgi:hypothetical protein
MIFGGRTRASALAACACACVMMLAPEQLAQAKGKLSPEERAFERALMQAAKPRPARRRRRSRRSKGKSAPMPVAKPAPTAKGGSGSISYSDGVAGGKLGTRRMRRANVVASRVLEARMRRYRRGELMLIRKAGAADVIVVRGSYDRVQDVLRALKIKHVVIPPHLLPKIPLMSTQTLMINCPGRLSRAGVRKVRRFVRTGGYLVTTDWALTLVQRALPGYITRGGRNSKNDVVSVHLHRGHGKGLLKHVAMKGQNPRWWLEASSYPIRILERKKVKVLISSKEMRKKYGHGAIAVLFRHDDGKVLHMTSHFYLQQAKLRSKREKAKGSVFAKAAGLSKKELAKLKKDGLDKVKTGELNSAYSMQQMTANVLVNRQASKRRLLRKYRKRARRALKLAPKPSAKPAKRRSAKVSKGFRLRVLERKGKRVRVRDLFGNEGWTDDSNLK